MRGSDQRRRRAPKLIGGDMNAAKDCELIGRWRIVEADLWERGVDPVKPDTRRVEIAA